MITPGSPPEGAYIPGASFGPDNRAVSEGDAVAAAKAQMTAPFNDSFGGLGSLLLGTINGLVGVLAGAVGGLFQAIGGLFQGVRRDVAKVEKARADGEIAIVNSMSATSDMLDESVRFGAAYMKYGYWRLLDGDTNHHTVPLTTLFPYSKGTGMVGPYNEWTNYTEGITVSGGVDGYNTVAKVSGALELHEPGLWFIFFQSAGRFFNGWNGQGQGPSRTWCYVTPSASTRIPHGPVNGSYVATRDMIDGNYQADTPVWNYLYGYGRATNYTGVQTPDGGYTTFGMFPVNLPDVGGFKVSMAIQNDWHYGGPASTYVMALKINTGDMRQRIEDIQSQIAANLPGDIQPLELTEEQIENIIEEAQGLE